VQRAGDRVRINVQLINASTDEHIWAETYDRELTAENLFAMQSEISREIVRELSAVLSDEDDERLDSIPTTNIDAYNAYVMGRQALVNRTAEGIYAAKAHFEEAIALDPDYALAYVGLADAYGKMPEYAGTNEEDSFAPRQDAIDKALELDLQSSGAYAALGSLRLAEERLEEAETYILRAIALNPKNARAYHVHALLLRYAGRLEEATLQIRKALEFDPAAPILTTNLVMLLHMQGRVEEALSTAIDGVKRSPQFPGFYEDIAKLFLEQGRIAEALRWALGARAVAPLNPKPRFLECNLYISLGDDASAESCVQEIRKDFPQLPERAVAHPIGQLYSLRGQNQAAVDYLKREVEQDEQDIGLRYALAFRYLVNSQYDEARITYQELEPAYFTDDGIVIDRDTYVLAVLIGILLYVDGEFDRANHLFDSALATMRSMHRTRGYGYQTFDVFIHVVRGDSQKAIAALGDAIDDGWRENWWIFRNAPFESMRAEPKWNALVDELEADIASQRAWFDDNKDEPLF
jgi:Flp pilus assembly protein TadD